MTKTKKSIIMNTLPYKWITVVEINTDISALGIKCCHTIICCTRSDCLRKTAHIKMSETSPSMHFLEEKRSVYTFVCARVTRLLFEHPSPAVMAGFDVPGVTSPLHLPCHKPISLSCLHSLRFPLTRGMCPSQLISILSPPFVSSPHWCVFLVISWTVTMWLHVKIYRPINNQMCDLQTKCRITCIWTAYFW